MILASDLYFWFDFGLRDHNQIRRLELTPIFRFKLVLTCLVIYFENWLILEKLLVVFIDFYNLRLRI